MLYNFDEFKENINSLIKYYNDNKGNRNEATTRLQLIDRLFFDCLAWSKDDVKLEESQNKKYADYTFYLPRRILIVEAKKEGNYFEIPAGCERLEYQINSLCAQYNNLKLAIDQVMNYCNRRGVPFGVVSNGHQIVAMIATRNDGVSPYEGRALVFPSIKFMYDNFYTLWQILSKPGVEQRNLQSMLVGETLPEIPAKLSSTIKKYPGIKGRNVF